MPPFIAGKGTPGKDEGAGIFGDGSDGEVEHDTGTLVLNRDMNYTRLSVRDGAIVDANGFAVRATEFIDVDAGGEIHNRGADATDENGAAAASGGSYGGGHAGGNGTTTAGANGTNASDNHPDANSDSSLQHDCIHAGL